jgi:23S rRNA (guanine2445-N2)-methyltransferase / 23S rRNA (guanine2069-N7)-methyltransferase
MFVTCPKGLEAVLAEEIGGTAAVGGVELADELELAYRACLWSRVASRVLWPIAQFDCPDEESLYRSVHAIDWPRHYAQGTLAVDFTSTRSNITHTHFGALKTKDAIVDRLREERGQRPSIDTRSPDLRVNVHLFENRASLAIDLSGESLHRRGYRRGGPPAPLKENLAAGLLRLARWPEAAREGRPFLDPMCGSGTLVIEAALMAQERAPGLERSRFGFHGWRGHDDKVWQRLRSEAAKHSVELKSKIVGRDADPRAVEAARAQAKRAGVNVTFEARAIAELEPIGERGVLVTNPPYGERLEADESLYEQLGDLLRRRMMGWDAFVLSGNPELAARIGLRAKRKHIVFNGAIECRLLELPIAGDAVKVEAPAWRRNLDKPTAGAGMFENRLRKNYKHWSRWAEREEIHCYRIYDADLPEYAVAIDLYEDAVHVQEYAPPKEIEASIAEARLRDVMRALPEIVGRSELHLKVRRRQKRGLQYEKVDAAKSEKIVREGGHRFVVNLSDYVDTGLFLDHRRLRSMIGELARGKRFLNLFAYTGTATVYAREAKSTTSVDLSNTYLDWAQRNFELNQMKGELIRADVLDYLPSEKRKFDLIFMAPPTFSNSKGMEGTLDIQRDHAQMITSAMKLLAPEGVLLFSNHFRRFKMDELPFSVENITPKTLPKDFARNPRIHNAWKIISSTRR